jgi:hypothetical protein
MSQSDGDPLGQAIIIMVAVAVLFTFIGDVWIHWPIIGAIVLVTCWSQQSMGKKKKKPRDR